jgi:hypothetical protein
MARIKLGPVVTDIAGSIGGMTIQRNKFGLTMRVKPIPLYSQTSAQYAIRRNIRYLQSTWQSLTDGQRLQWDRFLDFSGQTIRRDRSILLSGHTLYLKYQLFLLLIGRPLLTTIAYAPMPDFNALVQVEETAGIFKFRFTGVISSGSYFFLCKLSSPRRESQAYSSKYLRFMLVPFGTYETYEFSESYEKAFGATPPVDAFLHYAIRYISMTAPVFSGVYTGKLQIVQV